MSLALLDQISRSPLSADLELVRNTLRPTPHLKLAMNGMDLFAKLEYVNPVGSIKDRPAYWILKRAADRGEICEETTVIESSSGNFAAALAADWLNGQSRRAQSLGIAGTGYIARYVYDFLVDTGWAIENVRLYDTSPLESEKFRNTACRLEQHRSVEVVPHVADLLSASDLIVFTTAASAPHIADTRLFDHNPLVLHISLRDLAPEILLRSQNVVDDVEHVMTANTSPHLAEQQSGNRNFVTGTFAEIMLGRRSVNRSLPIIFSPFGMGILDVAVGKWVYDQAVAAGREQRVSDFFYEVVR